MNAEHVLSSTFTIALAVSILATVMSLGMSFSVRQVLAPLRRGWLVLAMVAFNAVLVPGLAWGLFVVMGLPSAAVTGLALTTAGAAGAVALKAAQISKRADLPMAVSLVVVLQLVNLVTVPLWAGRIVTGATISPGTILRQLLLLVLLPLVVGLALRARNPRTAQAWQPGVVRVSNAALGLALVAGLWANWSTIVSLAGSRVIVAAALVPVAGMVAGYLIGGREAATRTTTGIVSGVRFTSLA